MNRGYCTNDKLWLVVLAILMIPALAGQATAQQQLKVGVVDLQAVLDNSTYGKAAKERLKELSIKLQEEIKSKREVKEQRQEELQKLRQEIQTQGLVLSREAREVKAEAYRKKVRALKRFIDDTNRFIEDATQEFREREVRQTQRLLLQIRDVVHKLGKQDGYTLILEGNEAAAVVLYFDKTIDLTQQVTERYNQTAPPK
jgi:outer membrane protein